MPTITLESSDRSKRKNRMRSNLRAYGTRHGDKFWEEETQRNNFGLKYMNKFGWNKGDGLGKNNQGNIKHVKTKYKNDNRGVGCKTTQNDTMFQATMCMFNDILSSLNNNQKKDKDKNKNKNKNKNNQPISEPKYVSTSALIKSYEAKHHLYGKFRAATDISNQSEEQKRELFGDFGTGANGFTENDQEHYALRMKDIASMRSGKMGLGFGANNNNNNAMNNNTLTFGKFTRSGIITKEDLFECDNHNHDPKRKQCDKNPNKSEDINIKLKKKKRKKKKKKKRKNEKDEINIVVCERMNMDIKCKKKKKNKKRKLDDNDMLMQPNAKRVKLDKELINDNVSDVSSTASILSDVGVNEKKRKGKSKSKKKKHKHKKKKHKHKKKSKKKKNQSKCKTVNVTA